MNRPYDTLLGMLTIFSLALSLALMGRVLTKHPLPLFVPYYGTMPEGIVVADPAAAYEYFQNGGALFVDAREQERYEALHIPGALHFPADNFESHGASLSALRIAHAVIVYCEDRHCGASRKLVQQLHENGVNDLILMPEGIKGWKNEGYPVLEALDE